MVLKPHDTIQSVKQRFENDVKMYGTQTCPLDASLAIPFENDVKMYGTQTMTPTTFWTAVV